MMPKRQRAFTAHNCRAQGFLGVALKPLGFSDPIHHPTQLDVFSSFLSFSHSSLHPSFLYDDTKRGTDMVLASKFLCLFLVTAFLFLYYTLFGISPWDVPDESRALLRFDGGAREVGEIRMSSGEDNVGDDMAARMLARLRFLLGVEITGRARETYAPAPAPSFFAGKPPPFHFSRPHRRPALPVHHHIAPGQSLEYGSGNGVTKRQKRVVVIVAVLVGAAGVVIVVGTAIFLLCKSSRRRNSKKRSERLVSISRRRPNLRAPSGSTDNLSFDPTSDQFYLNSLPKYLENDFNMKNAAPGETIPNCQSPKNGHQDDDDDSFHSVSSQPLNHSALSSSEENFSPVSSYKSTSPVRNPTSRTLVIPQKVSTPTQSFLSSSSPSFRGRRFQVPSFSLEDDVSPLMAERTSSCPFAMEVIVSPLMSERAASSSFSMEDNASPIMAERASSSTARSTSHSNEAVVFSPMSGISNGHSSEKPPPPPPPPPIRPIPLLKSCSSARPPPPPPCPSLLSKPVGNDGTPLPKLKPLHWDKVRAAPDRLMVWDKIRSSSFEFDEKMIESLFGYDLQSSAKKTEEGKSKTPSPGKHVLEHKRLQNVTILMKALNATAEQVCNALMIGEGLTAQQLEALVKMAPTQEEEEELSKFDGNLDELDPSEKFLKTVLHIHFAFPRSEVMLFKETFEDEVAHLRSSFAMIEEACKELRSSRLFFRLLEAVLKTGNRMNVGTIRGGARAFKLDALLKLADVKGTDGKTTLLHFVVQEIVRLECLNVNEMEIKTTKCKLKTAEERDDDYKGTCLKLVSGLSTELTNVKKTATIDLDVLVTSVANLSIGLCQLKHLIEKDIIVSERSKKFVLTMKLFLSDAERIIEELKGDEKQVLLQVRGITEYYHGDVSKDESNPLRIFVIVRDFLCMLDRVCKDVGSSRNRHGPIQLLPFDRRS